MNLASFLRTHGYSQNEFARRSGIPQSILSRSSRGREPDLRNALRIVQATSGEVGLLDLLASGDVPDLKEPFAPSFPLRGAEPAPAAEVPGKSPEDIQPTTSKARGRR